MRQTNPEQTKVNWAETSKVPGRVRSKAVIYLRFPFHIVCRITHNPNKTLPAFQTLVNIATSRGTTSKPSNSASGLIIPCTTTRGNLELTNSFVRVIISFVRLIKSFVRLIKSFVRLSISFVRLIISFVRLIISFLWLNSEVSQPSRTLNYEYRNSLSYITYCLFQETAITIKDACCESVFKHFK